MEEKKNTGLIVVIIILTIVALSSVSFIIYDKVLNNKTSNNNDANEVKKNDSNNEEELKNATEEVGKLSNILALRFENDKKGKNLISYSEFRLELVEIMLPAESILTYNGTEIQEFPYAKYSTFKQKYTELFGNAENLDSDISEVSDAVATTDDTYVGKGYVSWNNAWGESGRTFVLTATDVEKDDSKYTINGTYTITLEENGDESKGTFTVEYLLKDGNKYYKSIVLN